MFDLWNKSAGYLHGALAVFRTSHTEASDVEHERHEESCPTCKAHAVSIELATRLMTDTAKTLTETADALEERSEQNGKMREILEGVVSIVRKHREYTLANLTPSPLDDERFSIGQSPSHAYLGIGENTALMSVQHGAIHLLVDMADEEPKWLDGGVCPCGDRGC